MDIEKLKGPFKSWSDDELMALMKLEIKKRIDSLDHKSMIKIIMWFIKHDKDLTLLHKE